MIYVSKQKQKHKKKLKNTQRLNYGLDFFAYVYTSKPATYKCAYTRYYYVMFVFLYAIRVLHNGFRIGPVPKTPLTSLIN